MNNGATEVAEVPAPVVGRGQLLIGTARTLVSAGAERMLVDFGKSNLLDKARQQPDKVRQVIERFWTDGPAPTLRAVRSKLEQPLPMGYCNAGVVLDVGAAVSAAVGQALVVRTIVLVWSPWSSHVALSARQRDDDRSANRGHFMKPSVVLVRHRETIRRLAASYRAANVRVFGSVLAGADREDSDLDLLVDPLPGATLFDLGGLQDALQETLGIRVDVLTPGDLPVRYRGKVLKEARPV